MPDGPTTLADLIRHLKAPTPLPPPTTPEKWPVLIERLSVPEKVHEIDKRTFDYFLEVLPPRWMGPGGFAFGEGADHLRLFWHAANDRFYCRQLTWDEHVLFARLAGIGLSSG